MSKRKQSRTKQLAKLSRREDRLMARESRPTKTVDQVWISNGKKFHPTWCNAMNGVWLSGSNAVRAIDRHLALAHCMELCELCEQVVHYEMR